jgi:hypothetical protein
MGRTAPVPPDGRPETFDFDQHTDDILAVLHQAPVPEE